MLRNLKFIFFKSAGKKLTNRSKYRSQQGSTEKRKKSRQGYHNDAWEITPFRTCLREIKSNNSLGFKEDLERKII